MGLARGRDSRQNPPMDRSLPRPCKAGIGLVLAALAGGCSANGMPTLQSLLPPQAETSSVAAAPVLPPPTETSLSVPGTPTGVFTQVAQGVLGCWFGAGGPLKASHVYRAEAEPPAKGGEAEIVLHERDLSLRDQRGTRAYKITFAGEGPGVRVIAMPLKIEAKLAAAMTRDVETWSKEGAKPDGGCQLRALFPPPPPAVAKAAKPSKGAGAKSAAAKKAAAKKPAAKNVPAQNAAASNASARATPAEKP
jgi:hypothetical protein